MPSEMTGGRRCKPTASIPRDDNAIAPGARRRARRPGQQRRVIGSLDGVEATRRLAGGDSPARILVLTTFDLDEYVHAAIRAGASGFLLKDVTPAKLLEAIRIVAAGDALLAPSVTRRLLERFASALPQRDGSTEAPAGLTTRETEVLRLLAGGLPNAEIAAELVVSEAKRRRTSPACCASWGCATASRR